MKLFDFMNWSGLLAALCLATTSALGQAADPQRPDGAPTPQPQDAPQAKAAPLDPQRPDERQPPDESRPSGENAFDPNRPRVIQLTLTPAAEPVPALKYELLPSLPERTAGNAATNYYRAILHAEQVSSSVPKEDRETFNQRYQEWMDKPLEQLSPADKAEMEKWVGYFSSALAETKLAAYREECHFDLRLQDLRGMESIAVLLHEFQASRELARVLRLRTRLEVQSGKLQDAIESLRLGFQLGRDVAEPELLINGLIGIAMASLMQEGLIEVIDQPGSPNLYWAIASLPRPLVDMRRGARFEMDLPNRMFPFLRDAETAERTPAEWHRLLIESVRDVTELAGTSAPASEWQSRLAVTVGLMMVYGDSKKQLVQDGFDPDTLEKMPVAQVVAIQASRTQQRAYHNVFKWTLLSYSQQGTRAADSLNAMVAEMGGSGQLTAADPLFLTRLLLPAVQQAMAAEIRMQTSFAGIQTIEALRMHAAAHDRQLPRTLDDVTVVPVPLNPATDQPFPYELNDGIATLTVPPPAGSPPYFGRLYVIRMDGN